MVPLDERGAAGDCPGEKEEFVFDFSYGDFLGAFTRAKLRVKIGGLVPYQARHSGPSIDRARGIRILKEISRRSRWQAASNVQKYERHARLSQTPQEFSHAQVRMFEVAERHPGDMLLGQCDVRHLPAL